MGVCHKQARLPAVLGSAAQPVLKGAGSGLAPLPGRCPAWARAAPLSHHPAQLQSSWHPCGGFLSLRAITLGCWHSTQVMARLPELPQGPPGCHGAVEPWLQGCVSAPTPCMVTCLVL